MLTLAHYEDFDAVGRTRLTCKLSVVGSNSIKSTCCFLKQKP